MLTDYNPLTDHIVDKEFVDHLYDSARKVSTSRYADEMLDQAQMYEKLLEKSKGVPWRKEYRCLDPYLLFRKNKFYICLIQGNSKIVLSDQKVFHRMWYNLAEDDPYHRIRMGDYGIIPNTYIFDTATEALSKYMELRYEDNRPAPVAFDPYMEEGEYLCLYDAIADWLELRGFDHILEMV